MCGVRVANLIFQRFEYVLPQGLPKGSVRRALKEKIARSAFEGHSVVLLVVECGLLHQNHVVSSLLQLCSSAEGEVLAANVYAIGFAMSQLVLLILVTFH